MFSSELFFLSTAGSSAFSTVLRAFSAPEGTGNRLRGPLVPSFGSGSPAGREVLLLATVLEAPAAGTSIEDNVFEKLFEVFHPTTREGKDAALASDTSTVGKLVGDMPERDDDVAVGPADAGRDVFRTESGGNAFCRS